MRALKDRTGIRGIRTLLAHGADPNTVDAQGTPALVQAIVGASRFRADDPDPIPVIQMLIKAGADPNSSTPDGATALHHEVDTTGGSAPIAQTLIDLDANPNAQDQWGNTPLHWYVRKPGSYVSEFLTALIDGGADPCIRNHNGATPLDVSRCSEECEGLLRNCSRIRRRPHRPDAARRSSDDWPTAGRRGCTDDDLFAMFREEYETKGVNWEFDEPARCFTDFPFGRESVTVEGQNPRNHCCLFETVPSRDYHMDGAKEISLRFQCTYNVLGDTNENTYSIPHRPCEPRSASP